MLVVLLWSIGGSVVEFSLATREARVRFPANAILFFFIRNFCVSFFFGIICVTKIVT